MDSRTLAYWLTLARLPGLGARPRIALLERFGSLDALFGADRATLAAALETSVEAEGAATSGRMDAAAAIEAVVRGPDDTVLAADLAWLSEEGHHLVTWSDADYPPLLREIPDPPLALYVHGSRAALARP